MSISYKKLAKSPVILRKLTGVTIKEFQEILTLIAKEWQKLQENKIRNTKPHKIKTTEDKLLCLLVYYKCYISHVFLGFLFNVNDSTITRLFQKLEPILARKIHIKKDRNLTPDKILELIVDVTEINIQRPKNKKKQKENYSGKKKRHTKKLEIIIDKKTKEIVGISKIFQGKTHDFTIRKNKDSDILPIFSNIKILADSGYQGLQKLYKNCQIPHKKSKKKPLTKEQKLENKSLSSQRILIENIFCFIKRFKILSEKYRNFGKKLGLRTNIIAGIINLKHGFHLS